MEMEGQQHQQLHLGVFDGIARLVHPHHRANRHKLVVNGHDKPPIDRQSLEHLVNFLDDSDSHEVTELVLSAVRLSDPSDGGVNVLRDFFSRSDTTLTKVLMQGCNFGTAQEASHLLAAFQSNRIVSDLTTCTIENLEGAALGTCLSGLMQNMPQLQRLDCSTCALRLEGVRVFQPALQANRALRELILHQCRLGDEGIRLIADALVGNTSMDKLGIGYNHITPVGLDHITRLLQSTRLQTIQLQGNQEVFDNEASTQRFTRILSRRHEFLKGLGLSNCRLGDSGIRLVADALVGNMTMKALDIHQNLITSVGLADITRLLESSTQLKTIYMANNYLIFDNEDATQHFVTTLQHKKSSLQELPEIDQHDFPGNLDSSKIATFASINNSLKRNQQLNHVNLLLAPLPQQQQQQQRNAGTVMLKTWHKAITKFAMVPNNAGASAIFKLFTARPQLLEKRLKRPTTTTTTTADTVSQQEQCKRRRL